MSWMLNQYGRLTYERFENVSYAIFRLADWCSSCAAKSLALGSATQPISVTSHARAGLALFKSAGNTWGASRAQRLLGRVVAARGDRAEARSRLEASLALDRALGDHHDAALSLLALGELVAGDGGTDTASSLYSEGLELASRAGDRWLVALSLERIGGLVVGKSPQEAVRLAGAADSLRTTLGAVAPAPDRARRDE